MSGLNQQFTKLSIRKDPRVRISLSPPRFLRSAATIKIQVELCNHKLPREIRLPKADIMFFKPATPRGGAQARIFDEKS